MLVWLPLGHYGCTWGLEHQTDECTAVQICNDEHGNKRHLILHSNPAVDLSTHRRIVLTTCCSLNTRFQAQRIMVYPSMNDQDVHVLC